jgi:phosphoribosylformimino-5-aminoimidazole carboxamide ribotide isomerase
MILLPAVDILDGKVVRLKGGEFDQATHYDPDPVDAARRFEAAGARALHVVDLDGARSGAPVNLEQIRRVAAAVAIPVQVGGGLRSTEAVRQAFEAGAARVVLGTAAYRDVDLLDDALSDFGEKVVVSVDARNGRIAASGWTEELEVPVEDVIAQLSARGVRRFVYSSIERDGMLAGPDLAAARRVARAVRGGFIYSGGISALEDLAALRQLREVNLVGVIVGKALYEARFTVEEAQRVLDRGEPT